MQENRTQSQSQNQNQSQPQNQPQTQNQSQPQTQNQNPEDLKKIKEIKLYKTLCFVLIVIAVLLGIACVLTLYFLWMKSTFIFKPPAAPKLQDKNFYPLGEIIPLTQEQIDQRNKLIGH